MDNAIMKKRFNTFKSAGGTLKNVSDDLLVDFLRSYEKWPKKAADFYREIGISKMQFTVLMKKAKKLCREGHHPENSEFKEIALDVISGAHVDGVPCQGIELSWDQGKVIRFAKVELLVDFLKKVA
jgi:hypothetical protein